MNDVLIVAITAASASVIGSICSIVISLINRKNTKAEIQAIHISVNSRMDELLAAAKGQSLSQGKAEGKEQERDEARERARSGEH
jgi:hypothetical protein